MCSSDLSSRRTASSHTAGRPSVLEVRESFDGLLPRAVDAVLGYAVEARDEAAPTGLLSGQALARAHLDARCKSGDFGKGGGFARGEDHTAESPPPLGVRAGGGWCD